MCFSQKVRSGRINLAVADGKATPAKLGAAAEVINRDSRGSPSRPRIKLEHHHWTHVRLQRRLCLFLVGGSILLGGYAVFLLVLDVELLPNLMKCS